MSAPCDPGALVLDRRGHPHMFSIGGAGPRTSVTAIRSISLLSEEFGRVECDLRELFVFQRGPIVLLHILSSSMFTDGKFARNATLDVLLIFILFETETLRMVHTSVSIAASIDEPWQWNLFFDEGGGVLPLLECIRDGARSVEQGGADFLDDEDVGGTHEASFAAACTACRALRDLSALSKDFAAVVTDDILRVNTRWSTCVMEESGYDCSSGGLISDLLILLKHANEVERFYKVQGKGGRRVGFSRSNRRKRRGKFRTINISDQIFEKHVSLIPIRFDFQMLAADVASTSSNSCWRWSWPATRPFRRFARPPASSKRLWNVHHIQERSNSSANGSASPWGLSNGPCPAGGRSGCTRTHGWSRG